MAASRLYVDRHPLAEALAIMCKAIPKRTRLAALRTVRLTASSDMLTLEAFDYEIAVTTHIPCVAYDFATVIDLFDLAAAIGKPSAKDTSRVTLEVLDDQLVVTAASTTILRVFPKSDDLPAMPVIKEPDLIAALSSEDRAAVAIVGLAGARDETLPVLQQIAFTRHDDGGWEAAATDRYRMAVHTVGNGRPIEFGHLTMIPAQLFAWFKVAPLTIRADGGNRFVEITAADWTIVLRSLDATFPRYQSLWPTSSNGTLSADQAALLEAVAAIAATQAKDRVPDPLRIVRDGRTVRLEVRTSERSITRTVPCEFDGDWPAEIGVNARYLADALKSVGKGPVLLSGTTPVKPVVVTGTGLVRVLVMPIRLTEAAAA